MQVSQPQFTKSDEPSGVRGIFGRILQNLKLNTPGSALELKALPPEVNTAPPRLIIFRMVEEDPKYPILDFINELALAENESWKTDDQRLFGTTKLAFSMDTNYVRALELRLDGTKWQGFGKRHDGRWTWETKVLDQNQYRITPSLILIEKARRRGVSVDGQEFSFHYGAIAGDNRFLSIAKTFNFLRAQYYQLASVDEEKKKRYGIRLEYVVTTVSLIELIEYFDTIEACRVTFDRVIRAPDEPLLTRTDVLNVDVRPHDKANVAALREALLATPNIRLRRIRGSKAGKIRSLSQVENLRFVLHEQAGLLREGILAALVLCNESDGYPFHAINHLHVEFQQLQEAIQAYNENRIDAVLQNKMKFKAHGRTKDGILDEHEGAIDADDSVVET